ncbi:probable ATP-dependent RNA helicase DHX35 [Coccomyxa sp. Obi]|nr:probable ATP-dependent RNA helicase DHX35 [Coccomyxa sp. Obi]
MAAFLRPGERQSGAFGVSFDTDRDTAAASLPTFNRNEKLALQDQRRRLPVYQHRREILYLVEHHATVIIVGETGSGKTTQIPQYLLEAGWCSHGRMVACTQPRRVAAMTVAARVAEETGSMLGQAVGYGIRFEDVSTPGLTQIRFCTDGVLLQEMLQDPLLTAYSVIMVDEAHERSLATDTLLGLLKKVQRRRPDLRVIIASATLEAERVAAFFDASTVRGAKAGADDLSKQPALLSVEGRTHSVQIHYLEKPCSDYVRTAVQTAADIHREDMPGDILIFLTGQQECEDCVAMLEEEARKVRAGRAALRLMPVPLYAGLPAAAQLAAFEHAPRGYRKVVVATNIAETSVTIDGVVFVIDSCFSKQTAYNPLTGLESLLVAPVSKASAAQRAGRAGRVRPGHCFRLCTEADFQALSDATVPEMQRAELSGTVLRLKALGVDNMMTFDWLAPPPAETMVRALELLHALGALDASARLSKPVGQQLAELPVDPRLGAALLASGRLGCSEEAATVVAMLSVHSVWAGARGERKALEAAKEKFAVGEGDLVTYLNVWKAWQESGRDRRWAARNCLNHRTLLRAADIRSQLCHHLRRLGIAMESCDTEVALLRKALAAGLLMNAVQLVETAADISDPSSAGVNIYRILRSTGPGPPPRLRIHASSVLARTRPQWLVFWQVQQSSSGWFEMQEASLTIFTDI